MGVKSFVTSAALLAVRASAQFASYSNSNYNLAVNVPSDSASSGSGPIYFQISAPASAQWVAFGQGTQMAGSNMFVVYASGNGNVTLSGRAGRGEVMPQYDSSIQVTLLGGSGIENGNMVANVRCDNCNSWNGGSMSFTSTSSNWIGAWKEGSALDSTDTGESIQQHDTDVTFRLDLTQGTGGSSSNPFVAAAAQPSSAASGTASGSASGSQPTASSTNSVTGPVVSSSPGSNSASSQTGGGSTSSIPTVRSAHGIIMSLLFLGLFPLASLTLYLPYKNKVRYVHAPLQLLSTILLIVGMALGIVLGQKINELDQYHMIIGFIVVACLILFQPAMGIYQHLHYRKTGGRSAFGSAHRWLGRSLIALGIINGGLGWMISGSSNAYVPYGVVAGIVFLIYIAVILFAWHRSGGSPDVENEKVPRAGYEMEQPRSKHARLSSGPPSPSNNAYSRQQSRNHGSKNTYTITGQ